MNKTTLLEPRHDASMIQTYSSSGDRVVPGILLMLGFCVTAPLLDVAAKLASDIIPVGQITTFRFVIQAFLMFPFVLGMGFSLKFPRRLLPRMTLRALFLIISTYCFVAAISVMPLADALAIVFIEPFILLLLGKWLFQEQVGPRRLTASIVGFIGVCFVIQPSLAVFGFAALFPLGTAFSFAFYMLTTRSLSRDIHPVPMQLHTAVIGSLFCIPALFLADIYSIPTLDPVMPYGIYWVWLFGVGLWASISHIMMSYALKFAPSATLAPLHYLEIVSAVILGFLIFGDLPNKMSITGMFIIIGSGLYVVFRERKLERWQKHSS